MFNIPLTPKVIQRCGHGLEFHPGFIQGSLSKIQGLLKTILQFSRAKSLGS